MNSTLDYLKNKRLVWQATQNIEVASLASTGFKELDAKLNGGFPEQGVIDIHSPVGIGELRLLLPNLRARQSKSNRLLVIVAPPMHINGELLLHAGFHLHQVLVIQPRSALHTIWSAEQCLKSGCCHSVLMWQQQLDIHQVKRLNLAAEQGQALHVIFHQKKLAELSLPVSLAMKLRPHDQGIQVHITKQKGSWPRQPFTLNMQQHWPHFASKAMADNVISLADAKAG